MKQLPEIERKRPRQETPTEEIEEPKNPLLRLISKPRGEKWDACCETHSQVLFLLHGVIAIADNKQINIRLLNEQFVFLPKGYALRMTACSDVRFILLNFCRTSLSCGKARLGKEIKKELEICEYPILDTPPLMSSALSILQNVSNMINENEYQAAKEHELWVLFWQCFPHHKVAWFLQAVIRPEEEFRMFVERNFGLSKTVSQIAIETNMCEDRFREKFKQIFRMSPANWQTQKRVSKMQEMVQSGETNIKRITAELGYKERASLNKFCQGKFGCSTAQAIRKINDSSF